MATVKLTFEECFEGFISSMSIAPDGGAAVTLNAPGNVSVEAEEYVLLNVEIVESDRQYTLRRVDVRHRSSETNTYWSPADIYPEGETEITVETSPYYAWTEIIPRVGLPSTKCTVTFGGDNTDYVSKITVKPDGGDALTLTGPGAITFDVVKSYVLNVEFVESDLSLWVDATSTYTDLSGNVVSAPTNFPSFPATFSVNPFYEQAECELTAIIQEMKATLYLNNNEGGPSSLTVTGQKDKLYVPLPDAGANETQIVLGWTRVWNSGALVWPAPTPPTGLSHYPGESVLVNALGAMVFSSDKWAANRLLHTRNGIAPYIWHNGQMREIEPYIWQNGGWVETKTALEIQGYFEREE